MKKLISVLALGIFLFGFTTSATGDLRELIDNLNNEIPFGYAVTQKITVDQISMDKVSIKSPIIKDELGRTILKYTVIFSQYSLSQILDDNSLLSQSKQKTFDFVATDTVGIMDLIATGDVLNPNVVYYVSVMPKDQNGIIGEMSNEIWFKLATQKYGEGTPTDVDGNHPAPGADMRLAGITHTITSNTATLRWTAIAGSDSVDIFLFNPTSETFDKLGTVNMSAEVYTFTLPRNGEYIVNFMPNNGGTELRYTFVANGVIATPGVPTPAPTPIIGKIPATGPKENVLVALGIALVFYLIYRRVRAKAKH